MRISTSQFYGRGLSGMLSQEQALARLSQQLSTGLKVQSPSDDPIASAQIELMNQRISHIGVLQTNRQNAENAARLEEGILGNMVTTLQRLHEIQVQAGNAAFGENERKALAKEAQMILDQLQKFANSKDGSGNYMFSGAVTGTQAISLNSAGEYVYNGDSTQRFLAVTGSVQVPTNDTGDNLFMRILNGNGVFSVQPGSGPNTGTAFATTGSVTNISAWVPDTYTISFANNTAGQLVTMVTGAASGNVIPPSGLPDDAPLYTDGNSISFNGIEVGLNGVPAPGDSFVVSPSRNESIFSTVQRIVANLDKPFTTAVDKSAVQTENNQLLQQLDSAMTHIVNFQSLLGSRLNQLDNANNSNQNLYDISVLARQKLNEIDYNEVLTELAMQTVALQAAQQTFVKIQGLSIFNFI